LLGIGEASRDHTKALSVAIHLDLPFEELTDPILLKYRIDTVRAREDFKEGKGTLSCRYVGETINLKSFS
jgi:hypothetical protein